MQPTRLSSTRSGQFCPISDKALLPYSQTCVHPERLTFCNSGHILATSATPASVICVHPDRLISRSFQHPAARTLSPRSLICWQPSSLMLCKPRHRKESDRSPMCETCRHLERSSSRSDVQLLASAQSPTSVTAVQSRSTSPLSLGLSSATSCTVAFVLQRVGS